MTDIKTMQDMLKGLKSRKQSLEADEKVFLKVSGLNEEIEKASQDRDEYEIELTDAKKLRDDAKAKKAGAVSETTSRIAAKMDDVLPVGCSVFTYNEDEDGKRSMLIGWKESDVITPYNGLSGMQKQVFDAALAHVLDANIIVVEAAELDNVNLIKTLIELSSLDKQIFINTCHSDVLKMAEAEGEIKPFQVVEI